jgi:hypothetical protein
MTLELLGYFVGFGLFAVIVSAWLWGSSGLDPKLDEASVIQRFQTDFPEIIVSGVLLSEDDKTAICLIDSDTDFGFVAPLGQYHLTRIVTPDMIKSWQVSDASIELRLRDFTLKRLSITMKDEQSSKSLIKLLQRVTKE